MAKKKERKNIIKKKDSFFAKLSFWLSMGFWIPMFNVGLSVVSLYYAFRALNLIEKQPENFSGFGYALAAVIISITALIGTVAGTIIYTLRKLNCAEAFF